MTSSESFDRDPSHWLFRLSPEEWIAAAIHELGKAETAHRGRNSQGLIAGVKRAAGMALNAALIARPRDTWGRTYVEHLEGLAGDERAPQVVRDAASCLHGARPPSSGLILLRSRRGDDALLEAARTIMAHAYAVVHGSHAREAT